MSENNKRNKSRKYDENGNAIGNAGALFLKPDSRDPNNDYFLLKLSVNGLNTTWVCFKNENKDFSSEKSMFDKLPAYFVFPYVAKNKDSSNGNSAE